MTSLKVAEESIPARWFKIKERMKKTMRAQKFMHNRMAHRYLHSRPSFSLSTSSWIKWSAPQKSQLSCFSRKLSFNISKSTQTVENQSHPKTHHKESGLHHCDTTKINKNNKIDENRNPMTSRFNEINIQMLPGNIQDCIFPNQQHKTSLQQVQVTRKLLQSFDLLGKTQHPLPTPDIELPPLIGNHIAEHFYFLGLEQAEPYLSVSKQFSKSSIPPKPSSWEMIAGWTRYDTSGGSLPEQVPFPLENELVFDVEVLMSEGPYPVIATAASTKAWYGWVSPELSQNNSKPFISLIPFGGDKQRNNENHHYCAPENQVIIGHHISFDRARILEEYKLQTSKRFFLDTMSLHCAVGGLSSQQRSSWSAYKKTKNAFSEGEFENHYEKEFYEAKLKEQEKPWHKVTSLNSLQDVANLHLNKRILKDQRKVFEKGTRQDILQDFNGLMDYCAQDVDTTFQVFQKLLPNFLEKCPHPVSFAGLVQMSRPVLTVNDDWLSYIKRADETMKKHQAMIESNLLKAAEDALEIAKVNSKSIEKDPWLAALSWDIKEVAKPKSGKDPLKLQRRIKKHEALLGKPQWYRDLWDPTEERVKITTTKRVAPYLLRLQWNGFPLFHTKKYGWAFRVPRSKLEQFTEQPLHFSQNNQDNTFDPIASFDENHVYFKIPHKDGPDQNCGNPLGKNYVKEFENEILTSEYSGAVDILHRTTLCNYWISSRQRIIQQFVIWQDKNENQMEKVNGFEGKRLGMILPQLVVMGTITRRSVESTWMAAANPKSNRIGSEVKAMIKPPEGYAFVGADVDSQELWIASLLGDAQFGIHGASPFGFMTLQGSKSNKTDLHSRTANLLGMSRDTAKIFNYARIYGAGVRYAVQLLKQFNPEKDVSELQKNAVKLYSETKGSRCKNPLFKEPFWYGGSESFMFNILEKIIRQPIPRTPILGCAIPDGLIPSNVRDDFLTSRVNWVVQSSGVDYLHLLLVSMNYLSRRMNIDVRFMLSIHDEVHFMVKKEHAYLASYALQVANLWTRSLFCSQVGINELPLSVAFFSSVDIDHCFRKEVYLECITPSHPDPIPPGISTDIYDTLSNIKQYKSENNISYIFEPELDSITKLKSIIPKDESSTQVMHAPIYFDHRWIQAQMAKSPSELRALVKSIK